MIAILSKKKLEPSTEHVQDWLNFLNAKYVRINGSDYLEKISSSNSENLFDEVNICWFRRWMDDDFITRTILKTDSIDIKNSIELYTFLSLEYKMLNESLWEKLKSKKWLTSPKYEFSNSKLAILESAEKQGLKCPKTIITTRKNELLEFKNVHKRIITKAIYEATAFWGDGIFYTTKTVEVTDNVIQTTEETFFPSLFQELVEKKYEIRTFFLKNKFYSMAIFSQLDKQTEIDFRNYNRQKPNRTVPYLLPEEITQKLEKLITEKGILTGSVDLIRGIDGCYYFLEINQVGQFGMTSYPCNYNLEKVIAEYLIENDTKDN